MLINRLKTSILGIIFLCALALTAFAMASDAANDASKPGCNGYGGLTLCVAPVVIVPDKQNYAATVHVTIESTGADAESYDAMLALREGAGFDAGGVGGWVLGRRLVGLNQCTNSIDERCKERSSKFTRLRRGSTIALTFYLRATSPISAALADAKNGSVTLRWYIAPSGGAVGLENFSVSGFPVKVILAPSK